MNARVVRELITIETPCGARVLGTQHVPSEDPRDVAFVMLNAGWVPRDGHGGLSVSVCDALARLGFRAFRFDMPGLGDAPGAVPRHAHALFRHVKDGGFAPIVAAIASDLERRFGARAIVPGGLCGASITAIWAADRYPSAVAGLVLFEPELFEAEELIPPSATWLSRLRARVFASSGWTRLLTMQNKWARFAPIPQRKWIMERIKRRERLPAAACVPLARAWRRVVAQGKPTLVITASGKMHELLFDGVCRALLSSTPTEHLRHHRVEGTNHVFTTGGAIERSTELVRAWAAEQFKTSASAKPPSVTQPELAPALVSV